MMKAIVRKNYGSPEVLSLMEIEKPIPRKNEVLVRVKATTVNRTDCGILLGKPYLIRLFTGLSKPRDLVPGTDFAGEIEAIGSEVENFAIGDMVWGLNDEGLQSHAEYFTIKASKAIVKIPKNISFEEAAASAEGAHYALNFINKVKFNSKSKVLVNGATGAIGSAAVQLLKYKGLYVTAVANTKNIDLIRSLGADKVVDYLKEDFTKDEEKYDFVFDAVGKSSFGKCKAIMKKKAVYISSELGPGAENIYLPIFNVFRGGRKVIFPIPSKCKDSLLYLNRLLKEGRFKPIIDREYKMENVKDAYNYVLKGEKTGNVILRLDEE